MAGTVTAFRDDLPTREQLAAARRQMAVRGTMPPKFFIEHMFALLEQHPAEIRTAERARVAEILRKEAASEVHGERVQDGLYLAAQLTDALTEDGIK